MSLHTRSNYTLSKEIFLKNTAVVMERLVLKYPQSFHKIKVTKTVILEASKYIYNNVSP